MAEVINLASALKDAGLVSLLVFVLIGGYRQWWAWGWQLQEAKKERDEWKALALRGTDMAARAVAIIPTSPSQEVR